MMNIFLIGILFYHLTNFAMFFTCVSGQKISAHYICKGKDFLERDTHHFILTYVCRLLHSFSVKSTYHDTAFKFR